MTIDNTSSKLRALRQKLCSARLRNWSNSRLRSPASLPKPGQIAERNICGHRSRVYGHCPQMKTDPNTATTIDNSGALANLTKLFTDIITDIFGLSVTFTLAKTDLSMAASGHCQLPQLT